MYLTEEVSVASWFRFLVCHCFSLYIEKLDNIAVNVIILFKTLIVSPYGITPMWPLH